MSDTTRTKSRGRPPKYSTPEERAEAQRANALRYYYKKKQDIHKVLQLKKLNEDDRKSRIEDAINDILQCEEFANVEITIRTKTRKQDHFKTVTKRFDINTITELPTLKLE